MVDERWRRRYRSDVNRGVTTPGAVTDRDIGIMLDRVRLVCVREGAKDSSIDAVAAVVESEVRYLLFKDRYPPGA